jgi:hypothetical protein
VIADQRFRKWPTAEKEAKGGYTIISMQQHHSKHHTRSLTITRISPSSLSGCTLKLIPISQLDPALVGISSFDNSTMLYSLSIPCYEN